jgi:hypothetical protein
MERSKEEVRDARNTEAIKLLQTDPEKFFAETRRRLPFGFSSNECDEDD